MMLRMEIICPCLFVNQVWKCPLTLAGLFWVSPELGQRLVRDLHGTEKAGGGKAPFLKWEQYSDLSGLEIMASLLVLLSGCMQNESKHRAIRCFHVLLPSINSCMSLFSLSSHKCRKDQSQKYFDRRRGVFLSLLPCQALRPGGDAGCQQR